MLEWYSKKSAELDGAEERLHRRQRPELQQVVKDKKILLFRRMLADIEYDDIEVADLLAEG
eukprot:9607800-Karenia_brevis.AAC.1